MDEKVETRSRTPDLRGAARSAKTAHSCASGRADLRTEYGWPLGVGAITVAVSGPGERHRAKDRA